MSPGVGDKPQALKKPRDGKDATGQQDPSLRQQRRKESCKKRNEMVAATKGLGDVAINNTSVTAYSLIPPPQVQKPQSGPPVTRQAALESEPSTPSTEPSNTGHNLSANRPLTTYSNHGLLLHQYHENLKALELEKTKTQAMSQTNQSLIYDSNKSRYALDSKTFGFTTLQKKHEALQDHVKVGESAEMTQLRDGAINQGFIIAGLEKELQTVRHQRDLQFQQSQDEKNKLLEQRGVLRGRLAEAERVAYDTGKDLLQSEINTLNRKIAALTSETQVLKLGLARAKEVAIDAAKFAKEEIQFLAGKDKVDMYLDKRSGILDFDKAKEKIRQARKGFEAEEC